MASILLLGSDRKRVSDVRALLKQDRHRIVVVRSVDEWRAHEAAVGPDLIVAATDSPSSVLSAGGGAARGFAAPLLFIQHDDDFSRDPHLDDRLVDKITGPFLSQDLLSRVDALVQVRRIMLRQGRSQPESENNGGIGTRLARWLGIRPAAAERSAGPSREVAARVAEWADRRDAFEPGHAERVAATCALIAEGLCLDDSEIDALLRAAMLHDIGKVCLPVEVLHQKSPLEEGQMRLMRTHPKRGAALLRALDCNDQVADTILYHHERPDGSGYYGLEADGIPRTAHILALAEVYDAMTNSLVKQTLSSGQALDTLRETKGKRHDADCVEALEDRLKPRPGTIMLAGSPPS